MVVLMMIVILISRRSQESLSYWERYACYISYFIHLHSFPLFPIPFYYPIPTDYRCSPLLIAVVFSASGRRPHCWWLWVVSASWKFICCYSHPHLYSHSYRYSQYSLEVGGDCGGPCLPFYLPDAPPVVALLVGDLEPLPIWSVYICYPPHVTPTQEIAFTITHHPTPLGPLGGRKVHSLPLLLLPVAWWCWWWWWFLLMILPIDTILLLIYLFLEEGERRKILVPGEAYLLSHKFALPWSHSSHSLEIWWHCSPPILCSYRWFYLCHCCCWEEGRRKEE